MGSLESRKPEKKILTTEERVAEDPRGLGRYTLLGSDLLLRDKTPEEMAAEQSPLPSDPVTRIVDIKEPAEEGE